VSESLKRSCGDEKMRGKVRTAHLPCRVVYFERSEGLTQLFCNTPHVVQDKCAPEAHVARREPAIAAVASAKAQTVNAQDDGNSDTTPWPSTRTRT
jgi:hypothetical protein